MHTLGFTITATCSYCGRQEGCGFVEGALGTAPPRPLEELTEIEHLTEALARSDMIRQVVLPQWWRPRWSKRDQKWRLACKQCNWQLNEHNDDDSRPRMFPSPYPVIEKKEEAKSE